MARNKRFTTRYYTYLSPTEDVDVIDYIDNTYGNGIAEKVRNSLRALVAEHQRAKLTEAQKPKVVTITPPPQPPIRMSDWKPQEPHPKVTITLPNEREKAVYKLREQLWAALNDKSLSVSQYARNKASRYYYLGEGKLRRSEGRGGPDIEGAISQFDAGLSFMSRHMPTAAPQPEPDVLVTPPQETRKPHPKVTTTPPDWLHASPAERIEMANKYQMELHDIVVRLRDSPAAQKSAVGYLQKGQKLLREKYDVVGAIRHFQAGIDLFTNN